MTTTRARRPPWNLSLTALTNLIPTEEATPSLLAARIGVNRRAINRWHHEGIPAPSADRAATRLGYHPHQIWGPLAYELAEQLHHAARTRARHEGNHRPPTPNAHVSWERNGRFCGRHPHEPAGHPHTCATDGCNCPNTTEPR